MTIKRYREMLTNAVEIIQHDRDALVDCHTYPIGNLASLDCDARDAFDLYEAFLSDARVVLAVRK
jgi:hypothetical protein